MTQIDLNVPFAEKDNAKRLGARWDRDRKVWYVPNGVNPNAFERWLPKEPEINVRSTNSYSIAQTEKSCWKCGEYTNVFGFILPAGHEVLEFYDDEDEELSEWCQYDEPTIVHYITDLLPAVSARIKKFSRHYRVDFSKTTESYYWMNHCECCGMKQGDFDMFCEPQGAFFPLDEYAASQIVLYEFDEPFGCNGSTVYGGDHLFEYMQRAV